VSVMLSRRRFFWSFTAAGLATVFSGGVFVAPALAVQDPNVFVTDLGTRGINALRPGIPEAERLARQRKLFRHGFDVGGIGTFALGRYRWQATPQEQQQYMVLYQEFIVHVLSNKLNDFSGASFRVTGRGPAGDDTIITSELARTDGNRMQLDWHLISNGGRYRVTDLGVDGVSMKIQLRDRFASWVQDNGGQFRSLLAVLRQEIEQLQ
jgi:phospholipid transport system substrate-binding protein